MDSLPESIISKGLALSLVNEPLESGPDLVRFLERVGLEPRELDEVALRLPEFRTLRAASRAVLEASVNGTTPPVDAVTHLNEVSGRVPRVLVLDPPLAREDPVTVNATARTLARVAWSTIEVVGGPERERLHRCPSCGDVFIATRSDRRWCSVACGNRVRVARHHARRRAAG
jgi:predicted RNA-binding Zn ribbon-like protein